MSKAESPVFTKVSRRRFLTTSGILVSSAIAAGCTGGTTTEKGQAQKPQSERKETGSERFLALPYKDPEVRVNSGFQLENGANKGSIDFVKRSPDRKFLSFEVDAAAEGKAIAFNSPGGLGWTVIIVHPQYVDEYKRVYITRYANLKDEAVATNWPVGDGKKELRVTTLQGVIDDISSGNYRNWTDVKVGEKIGTAGQDPTNPAYINLDFGVYVGVYDKGARVDPFGIYGALAFYPTGNNFTGCGKDQNGRIHPVLWSPQTGFC